MRKLALYGFFVGAFLLCISPQALAVGTPAGTVISNKAYADYQDANGNPLSRVFSNTVTTTVSQVAGVDVSPPTAASNAIAGTDISYAATICNTGNGSDTITLAASTITAWTTTIYRDTNENGVLDAGETTVVTSTGALAADTCFYVIVVVSVPSGTADGTLATTTLTGTSTYTGTVSDSAVFTTDVEAASLIMTKAQTPSNPKPGDEIIYAITGTNLGSTHALNIIALDEIPPNTTYVAGSMRVGPIGGTYATATALTDANDAQNLSYTVGSDTAIANGYYNSGLNRVELTWSQCHPDGVFYFKVTVNASVVAGTGISNTLTSTYELVQGGTRYTENSNTTIATVAKKPAILLDPNRSGSYDTGDQVAYSFTATNTGNADDTINLPYTSSAGWTWALWVDSDANGIPGTNGDYLLTDTNADGIIDTGILTANVGSIAILAVATVPAHAADASVDTTTITGTSVLDPTVTDPEVLTTTVKAPVLSMTKTVEPIGSQPPGTELTYTITVTNIGTGAATSVIITDIIPTHTTYVAGSIKTGATVGTLTPRTDDADSDGGRYDVGTKAVLAGAIGTATLDLGHDGTWILQFKVTIK